MLEGASVILGNRYTHKIFIENGAIYIKWGYEIFSLSIGGPCKKLMRSTGLGEQVNL